ncbi:hypothetical protein IV72_GL001074 [Atopobium minutum]|nr:hypothetical protein IV72_GL001074 [Atopobium minutum]
MNCVLVAPRAILLQLHTLGVVALVFICGVIPTLALGACEGDHSTHETSQLPK